MILREMFEEKEEEWSRGMEVVVGGEGRIQEDEEETKKGT